MNNKIQPFSNGSEYQMFIHYNCENCLKYNFNKPKCKIDIALGIAYLSDGKVTQKIYDCIKTGKCLKFIDKKERKKYYRTDKQTLSLWNGIV